MAEGIKTKKNEDLAEWYSEVVLKGELADHSALKGFMVIRPAGYAIWQHIQDYFNKMLKKNKVENAYFPLLIPEKFFKKEAKHAEGFEPELAWVQDGEEKYAIRPTSETIIYDSFSKWIRSHRDLPLKINQWANILRWEVKQTKIFLRTREFLWQEGHCAYKTKEETIKEVRHYLKEYEKLCKELLAIPVIAGTKSKMETFAGAEFSETIETLMPDGKALQCATSHNLGKNFAKAFNLKYKGEDEQLHTPWLCSWGVTTRLIGATVMLHGDDKGLVIPPKVAQKQIVIIPIIKDNEKEIMTAVDNIKDKLKDYRVHIDDRQEYSPGWKFNEWEMKGIPLRIEIGQRDLEKNQVTLVRRDTGNKKEVKFEDIIKEVEKEIEQMMTDLYSKAKELLNNNIVKVNTMEEFKQAIKNKKLVKMNWCNTIECEEKIQEETSTTSRCIPFKQEKINSKCPNCGKEAKVQAIFGRSY